MIIFINNNWLLRKVSKKVTKHSLIILCYFHLHKMFTLPQVQNGNRKEGFIGEIFMFIKLKFVLLFQFVAKKLI